MDKKLIHAVTLHHLFYSTLYFFLFENTAYLDLHYNFLSLSSLQASDLNDKFYTHLLLYKQLCITLLRTLLSLHF